jgi:hypothetical protein
MTSHLRDGSAKLANTLFAEINSAERASFVRTASTHSFANVDPIMPAPMIPMRMLSSSESEPDVTRRAMP